MELNKKQFKGLLNILSNDRARPMLCCVYVKNGFAYATDGYHAVRWAVELADTTFVDRRIIDIWCKHHDNKETTTLAGLIEWCNSNKELVQYEMSKIRKQPFENEGAAKDLVWTTDEDYVSVHFFDDAFDKVFTDNSSTMVNASLMLHVQEFAGEELEWSMHGSKDALVAVGEQAKGLVMPMRGGYKK